jgi:hypothetical protein
MIGHYLWKFPIANLTKLDSYVDWIVLGFPLIDLDFMFLTDFTVLLLQVLEADKYGSLLLQSDTCTSLQLVSGELKFVNAAWSQVYSSSTIGALRHNMIKLWFFCLFGQTGEMVGWEAIGHQDDDFQHHYPTFGNYDWDTFLLKHL